MTAAELYQAGKLDEAIESAIATVREHPGELPPRWLLAELACFAGQTERADKQLDVIGDQDPQVVQGVALFRHLIRAEQARRQVFTQGRVPELLDKPDEELKLRLQALVCLREGDAPAAAELLERAEALRPAVKGTCDGTPFDDLRDVDDLTASVFEVLTSGGTYYWIPMARVDFVAFHPPRRPRDLLWRPARMVVRGGPDGEVYIAALYPGTHEAEDARARLGRLTDWVAIHGQASRGVGQRLLLVGDEDLPLMQIGELVMNEEARP